MCYNAVCYSVTPSLPWYGSLQTSCSTATPTTSRGHATTTPAPYVMYAVCWPMRWRRQLCAVSWHPGSTTATLCCTAHQQRPSLSCNGLRTTSPASSASAQWSHRCSAAAEVAALAARETPHHVQDQGADQQGADDVHGAIHPRHADRRDACQTDALCRRSSAVRPMRWVSE